MRHSRHFTLDHANAEIPWVMAHLDLLRRARERLTDEQARRALAEGSATNGGGRPGRVVGEAFVAFQNGVAAFDARGIVLRDLDRGLIDFPALRDGEEVYLCWIEGETEITFWHELDAGFAGRRRL